jgi:formamidopyrimidine-DNA glycosylase
VPELPEVETMRRGILPIVGRRIVEFERAACPRKAILIRPRIDRFRKRVIDHRVEAVERVGKRVVVVLDSADAIVFEPRMTGLVLLAHPPDPFYVRVRMRLAGAPELLFWDRRGLGVVQLLSPDERNERLGIGKLGPDALVFTPELFRERLGDSQRQIKVALLDQKAIAGIGNLYASEILHRAGIHPARRCHRLTRRQWSGIHAATLEILHAAIRHEGSTLSDGSYCNALSEEGGYQNHHRVYDRAGQSCLTCRTHEIIRVVQSQRSTFFCPLCQHR